MSISVQFVKNLRARHYNLRITSSGAVRVTIPKRGSLRAAKRFVDEKQAWIAARLAEHSETRIHPHEWKVGSRILLRGQFEELLVERFDDVPVARLGDIRCAVAATVDADHRQVIEHALRRIATEQLHRLTHEMGANFGLSPHRVTVRGQKTRWGSCSAQGALSLNWRLIHVPPDVRDYLIIHELCHLKHLNHSPNFWHEVERACPHYRKAEAWLKAHASILTD